MKERFVSPQEEVNEEFDGIVEQLEAEQGFQIPYGVRVMTQIACWGERASPSMTTGSSETFSTADDGCQVQDDFKDVTGD